MSAALPPDMYRVWSPLLFAATLLCVSCTAPVRGRNSVHFSQSCGAACSAPTASSTGELLAPAPLRTRHFAEKAAQAVRAIQGVNTVAKFLDESQRTRVERILVDCASEANFKVNEDLFGQGKALPESECDKNPNVKDKTANTWRQHLGNLKHAAAFRCVEQRLGAEFAGNFSIEPRYRNDPLTGDLLLTDRRLGSLRPDVVLHFTRNATRIQCIYDFKFPCDVADRRDPLADSRVRDQLRGYNRLGNENCFSAVVTPGLGINRISTP